MAVEDNVVNERYEIRRDDESLNRVGDCTLREQDIINQVRLLNEATGLCETLLTNNCTYTEDPGSAVLFVQWTSISLENPETVYIRALSVQEYLVLVHGSDDEDNVYSETDEEWAKR